MVFYRGLGAPFTHFCAASVYLQGRGRRRSRADRVRAAATERNPTVAGSASASQECPATLVTRTDCNFRTRNLQLSKQKTALALSNKL